MLIPLSKQRNAASVALCVLLCMTVLIVCTIVAPLTAEASGVDSLIKGWESKYGKSDNWRVGKAATAEEIKKAKQEGKPYRTLPIKGHVEQNAALRSAVARILSQYDISASMLNPYRPSFSFWADKNDNPYWRIRFEVPKDQSHKTIVVEVNATNGSIRYITPKTID